MNLSSGILRKNRRRLLLAACLLLVGVHAGKQDLFVSRAGRPLLIIAHRGMKKFAPENTLPAIEKAIEMQLDYVEVDVRTTKDGRLVLMHDSTVDRTTTGHGAVRDLTLDEIKRLDAGSWFGEKFAGTPVPTFEELLKTIRGRINVYLDWKDADPAALADAIMKSDTVDSVLVLADPARLWMLHRINKRIHRMADVQNETEVAALLKSGQKFEALSPPLEGFTPKMSRDSHAAGAKIFVDILGFGEPCQMTKAALKLGADAVQSDHSDLVVKCLNALQKKQSAK